MTGRADLPWRALLPGPTQAGQEGFFEKRPYGGPTSTRITPLAVRVRPRAYKPGPQGMGAVDKRRAVACQTHSAYLTGNRADLVGPP